MSTRGCFTYKTCMLYIEPGHKINFMSTKTRLTIYLYTSFCCDTDGNRTIPCSLHSLMGQLHTGDNLTAKKRRPWWSWTSIFLNWLHLHGSPLMKVSADCWEHKAISTQFYQFDFREEKTYFKLLFPTPNLVKMCLNGYYISYKTWIAVH